MRYFLQWITSMLAIMLTVMLIDIHLSPVRKAPPGSAINFSLVAGLVTAITAIFILRKQK